MLEGAHDGGGRFILEGGEVHGGSSCWRGRLMLEEGGLCWKGERFMLEGGGSC